MKYVDVSSETGDAVPHFLSDWFRSTRHSRRAQIWKLVLDLAMEALLAHGKRTVSSCLQ